MIMSVYNYLNDMENLSQDNLSGRLAEMQDLTSVIFKNEWQKSKRVFQYRRRKDKDPITKDEMRKFYERYNIVVATHFYDKEKKQAVNTKETTESENKNNSKEAVN
jgi:hypothetical protein